MVLNQVCNLFGSLSDECLLIGNGIAYFTPLREQTHDLRAQQQASYAPVSMFSLYSEQTLILLLCIREIHQLAAHKERNLGANPPKLVRSATHRPSSLSLQIH
jgi:hypothetical protein